MNDRQRVFEAIRDGPHERTVEELATVTGLSSTHIRPILHGLIKDGLVEQDRGPKWSSAREVFRVVGR